MAPASRATDRGVCEGIDHVLGYSFAGQVFQLLEWHRIQLVFGELRAWPNRNSRAIDLDQPTLCECGIGLVVVRDVATI